MLSFADPRWPRLTAGYRIPVDLRPLLRRLESGSDTGRAWEDLWRELHHQGDVGNGSYVAVPHLVRIHRERGVPDWNTYALVATIELARARGSNPEVPGTDRVSYEQILPDSGYENFRQPKILRPLGRSWRFSRSFMAFGRTGASSPSSARTRYWSSKEGLSGIPRETVTHPLQVQ